MSSAPPSAVVVAGMHRSGTSMVGGMLAACGVDMGRRLIAADRDNERGYFEDADIVSFHGRLFRELLPAAARGHVDWGWCEDVELDASRVTEFTEDARRLVAARERRGRLWGFKDPRTTVLLDFWERWLPGARYVLVYRFPWEVADSMQRGGAGVFLRNPEYAYRVWAHYNERLLAFFERNPERCALVCSNVLPQHLEEFRGLLRTRLGLSIADADLAASFDARLFTAGDPADPRADLVDAAYPKCTDLLRRLDAAAQIGGVGAWRARPASRPFVSRPDDPGEVDVSIVVPTHDDGVLLLDALASVERCRPSATELAIVNDGSTDPETLRILAALRQRGWFVVDKPAGGLSSARNTGIARMRGRFILPLDADNRLRPGFVEAAVEVLERDPAVGVVYGDRQLFGGASDLVRVPEFDLSRMLGGNYIDACAVHRRELWTDVGGYDEAMTGLEDWDYWLGAGRRGWGFVRVDGVTFDYRVRPGSLIAASLSPAKRRQLTRHVLEKHRDLLRAHVPRVFRAASAVLGPLLPESWRERVATLETRMFWRTLWFLIGPGGLLAADRARSRSRARRRRGD